MIRENEFEAEERISSGEQEEGGKKKKRLRRSAQQIPKYYICQVEKCSKSYGSEGSLRQHMKLKHS